MTIPRDELAATPSGWRLYVGLVKQSGVAWIDDRAPTMGAALAFYSAFSLAPLLIIVIALAGAVFGMDAARGAVVGQLAGLVGAPAAEAIRALLKAAQETATGVVATAVGLVTMLVGATTILVELQDDLDHIWKAPPRAGSSLLTILRARVLSLGMILGIGFLLLVSLVLSAAMQAVEAYSASYFPGGRRLWGLAFRMLFVSIAASHRALRDAVQMAAQRSDTLGEDVVAGGAFITAVLFSVGRICDRRVPWPGARIASAYGAAGTLAVLLLWLFYSAQVFLLGAEFTCIHAKHRVRRSTLAQTPLRSTLTRLAPPADWR